MSMKEVLKNIQFVSCKCDTIYEETKNEMYKGTNLKERWSSGGQTNGRRGFNLKTEYLKKLPQCRSKIEDISIKKKE